MQPQLHTHYYWRTPRPRTVTAKQHAICRGRWQQRILAVSLDWESMPLLYPQQCWKCDRPVQLLCYPTATALALHTCRHCLPAPRAVPCVLLHIAAPSAPHNMCSALLLCTQGRSTLCNDGAGDERLRDPGRPCGLLPMLPRPDAASLCTPRWAGWL